MSENIAKIPIKQDTSNPYRDKGYVIKLGMQEDDDDEEVRKTTLIFIWLCFSPPFNSVLTYRI